MPPERKRDYDWHHHYTRATIGLAILMHEEVSQVAETISRMKPRTKRIVLVRTGTEIPKDWEEHLDKYDLLPALMPETSKWEIPSVAITRGYSLLARVAAGFEDVDWWVFLTGDTVLLHEYGIERAIADAAGKDCVLACCRALKQDFHAAGLTIEDLEAGRGGGRKQTTDLADFQPQLFMVRGDAIREGLFHEIPVTNRWCSEQALGDAFTDYMGPEWRKRRHVYATAAGEYADGVVFHAKYGA